MKQKLTLIKLGGSVITNKEVPMVVRDKVLSRLVGEIGRAQEESEHLFLVGHGQGSFAHSPAMRYQTMDGFIKKDSVIGMAITQDSAAQLNRIVVKEFIDQEVPAVSFYPSNSLVTKNKQAFHFCSQVLTEYLDKGLLPVTGGDVIVDDKIGCTIWSTEKVLGLLVESLSDKYEIDKIIHVTEIEGVLDESGQVVEQITMENAAEVKKLIFSTKGFDVTGGMWHKIEESLELYKKWQVKSFIISGNKRDNLYECLLGRNCVGTVIGG